MFAQMVATPKLSKYCSMAVQVTRLGIEMEAEDWVPYLQMQQCIQKLARAVRHCAPSLRIVRLRLFQTTAFRDYEADAMHPDGLQDLLVGPQTIFMDVGRPILHLIKSVQVCRPLLSAYRESW